jgi:ATP-dependent Clp protease adapter protein ClpS
MWLLISIILGLVVIYLLSLLSQKGDRENLWRRVFSGIETHVIVIIDDNSSPMETVVNTLVGVIGMPEKQAVTLMLRIHHEGIAIVWTGDRNTGEQHLADIQMLGLQGFLAECDRIE